MEALSATEIRQIVRQALAEDIGAGDVTTSAVVPAQARARARMVARQPLVVCGLALAEAAFRQIHPKVRSKRLVQEGRRAGCGTILLALEGPAQAILTAERVALNFVQRLSGIATFTSRFVAAVSGTGAQILDTRKTTPGMRRLEKYAVACGGGKNHRFGLYDLVLIKDNHLAALALDHPNPIAVAVARARQRHPKLKLEVEADNLAQVQQAVEAGADIVLLDNMDSRALRKAVRLVGGRALTEASGGVTLERVAKIARTGVDYISVGALTHSSPAADIGLDFIA